ncbi:hypothetical protein VSS37_09190, partial [Candidatus Thiothrix sp. Deng01]
MQQVWIATNPPPEPGNDPVFFRHPSRQKAKKPAKKANLRIKSETAFLIYWEIPRLCRGDVHS